MIAELTERLPDGWVLVGGLMVQLHAIETGCVDVRPTRDIDVLGQARPPGALAAIDAALRRTVRPRRTRTSTATGIATSATEIIVDVLAPDGLSRRRVSEGA